MTHVGGGMGERLTRAGVTEREAEVLRAVAQRLRNREIAERLHVSIRTVESHIAALLRKLHAPDRAALADLGAELRRVDRSGTVLPTALTRLVGRQAETGQIIGLLDTHRLVTLIGPGGVGKTRLALHVATRQTDRFDGGVRLADLAAVGADLVGDVVARALGVVPEPGWPLRDILREVAADLDCLLLVDNCEHVVDEAAAIVADLLSAGGGIRVLATSREPLGMPGEVSYPVQPLPVPALDAAKHDRGIEAFDAVRLFVDRAASASPGFALTDAIAPAVAALCQRLDGLPLAIELAASRMRTFGPLELVEHLDSRFTLLSAGARTARPRHRTLRAAIDWSYELLDDDERTLFERLGAFPADFDYPAVEAVCHHKDPGVQAAIQLLPALVDKSLVATVERDTRRYRLLETIRVYAAERLATSGAEPAARQAHADHYLTFAEQACARLQTADQRVWLDRMTTEEPNLRAALAHTIEYGDTASAWRAIAALRRFWDTTGQRRAAREWIQRTLAAGDPPATPVAVAGLAAASAILQPSDSQAAFDLATRATQLAAGLDGLSRARAARALGMGAVWVQPELVQPSLHEALAGFGDDHPWDTALTMQGLASTCGTLPEAMHWGRSSVALFRSVGDQMYAANTLFIMAQRSIYAGVCDHEVHGWLTESQRLAEAAGSEEDITHATVGFGQLAWLRGDHDHAAELMQQCLPTLRRLGDRRCTGRALYVLGERAHQKHDLTRAEDLLHASIEAVAVAGQSFVLVWALEALAAVAAAQHRPRYAAALLGSAHRVRDTASAHMRPIQPPDDALRRSLIHVLGNANFDHAHAEGARLSPAEVLNLHPDEDP